MRNRMVVATVLGLIPVLVSAQRIPVRIPTSIPREPRTSPGEPEPAPIARQLAYTRSHYWFESVAFASWIDAPGFGAAAGPRSWTLFGSSTHAEYRTDGQLAPTIDLAGATFGDVNYSALSPENSLATLISVEPGVRYRLRPLAEDFRSFLGRFSPFVDLRANYLHATNSYFLLASAGTAQQTISGSQLGWGAGGVAGAGTQIFLTPSWSVLTELSTVADRMRVSSASGAPLSSSAYWLHWQRLSLGLNYNHISYRELAQRSMP